MNHSNDKLKKSLDARANNLYNRIIQSQFLLVTPGQIEGCSSSEITKIEDTYKLPLPYSYKVFLRYFGRRLYGIATDLEFVYPNVLSLTQYERDIDREIQEEGDFSPEELLPKNAFVFARRYTMEFWYFLAEEGVDDPSIFFDECDGNVRKIQESIFDFWEAEVEYAEKLIVESKEREKRRQEKEKEKE